MSFLSYVNDFIVFAVVVSVIYDVCIPVNDSRRELKYHISLLKV